MATVRKPIALNETFKTTESTPRNLADVLAQALQALNTTISGLNFINCVVVQTLPTTDISTTTIYLVPKNPAQTDNLYDEYINLTGTSAGWEKIGDTEIDLSYYYNKTETDTLLSGKVDKEVGKGLSTNDYTTAEKTKLAGIEAGAEVNPTSDVKTATESFETVDGGLLSKCMIDLKPVQDLHGYDSPWGEGTGKNKLPLTIAKLKADNISGTWNGNVYSHRGIDFAITEDNGGNVIEIDVNGTSNADYATLALSNESITQGSYRLNGISNGNQSGLRFDVDGIGSYKTLVNGELSLEVSTDTVYSFSIIVRTSGYTVNHHKVNPMIRLSTESDPTFEPYSNICPISGHTEVELAVNGKNWCTRDTSANIYNAGHLIPVKNGDTIYCYFEFSSTQNGKMYGAFTTNKEETNKNNTTNLGDFTSGTVKSYTMTADGYFCVCYGLGVATYTVDKAMISTSPITDYEPYLGHLYQVQIGSTVYGGYVDLVSGVMTVVGVMETFDGTASLTSVSPNMCDITTHYRTKDVSYVETITENKSNYLVSTSRSSLANGTQGFAESTTKIRIKITGCSSQSDYQTYLTSKPLQVYYLLETAQTIQLAPQQIEALVGQNNLSTPLSGQSIETNGVEYKELFTFADVKEYVKPLISYSNAGSHNAIYRGKYLGSSVTADQWSAIQNGTFDDLFIGDYWTINSVNWRIAHFDYWLVTGNVECTDHHVVIVPDTKLYDAKMNSTDITTGGYYNSEMRGGANYLVSGSSNLYTASETIKSAFGSSHILTHREILTNAVSSGNASNWAWYDSSVELMSEVMVCGTLAWSEGGKGFEVGIGKSQFALFRHDISKVTIRVAWWLRGIYSAEAFTSIDSYGRVSTYNASNSRGVRPCFAIK